MSVTMKYEMMILLSEEFNDSELKTWAFNYAKALRKLKHPIRSKKLKSFMAS